MELENLTVITEHQLVLLAARAQQNTETVAAISKLLKTNIDWEEVIRYATVTGLLPITAYNLYTANGLRIPQEIQLRLRKVTLMVTARNMQMYQTLAQVVSALQEHGIDVIVLKGPVLAATVYPHIGTRQFCDLDLLIKKADLPKVESCITKLGYFVSNTGFSREFYEKHHFHLQYINHSGQKPIVEVHWNLDWSKGLSKLNINEFWENTISVNFEGIKAYVLSPEDTICMLCLHNINHLLNAPKILSDIDWAINAYGQQINWQKFLADVRIHKLDRMAYASLFYVHTLFHSDIPIHVLEQLKPRWHIVKRLKYNLFHNFVPRETKADEKTIQLLLCVSLSRNRLQRLRYLLRLLFPPLEVVEKSKWTYIHYFARLFYLVKKYIKLLLSKPSKPEHIEIKRTE